MKRLPIIILIAFFVGFTANTTAQRKRSKNVKKEKVIKVDSSKTDTVLKIRIPPFDSIPIGNAKDAA